MGEKYPKKILDDKDMAISSDFNSTFDNSISPTENNRKMSILEHIKQIHSLSEIGIHYAHNDFDLERYREISTLCLAILSDISGMAMEDLKIRMTDGIGYKTPKVDIRAVVFNDQGHLLMVREKIDGCWSVPGGWADIGYTPSEVAVKETREEAGVEVKPERILAILDKKRHEHPADIYYVYKIFIECRITGSTDKKTDETDEVGYFPEDQLPPLSGPRNTAGQISLLFDIRRGLIQPPVFD